MSGVSDLGLGLEQGVNRLCEHNPLWAQAFEHEAARLRAALGARAIDIQHYGSTAVAGLRAKPILDLLIGVAHIDEGLAFIPTLGALGYDYAGSQGIAEHHIFGLGLARTHLTHVIEHGGEQWRRCLLFRDRLRAEPKLRRAYEALKLDLAARYPDNRPAYTAGKSAFIEHATR
jgi:GrpB-like predicted nucleotidyltransferase (UPF0157 family)